MLWVRPIDSTAAVAIAGTENAEKLFWSPDSRWIGFSTNGKLQKLDFVGGGQPQEICDIDGTAGATWNRNGVIVFDQGDKPLQREEGCGINEYSGTGLSGNTISNNTVSDAYCGVAAVQADHVSGGTYYNTLYTELDADLYPCTFPPAGEPVALLVIGPGGAISITNTFQTASNQITLDASQSISSNPGTLTYSSTSSPGFPSAAIIGANTAKPTFQLPSRGFGLHVVWCGSAVAIGDKFERDMCLPACDTQSLFSNLTSGVPD